MSADEVFEKLGEIGVAKFIAEDKDNSALLPLAKVWLAGKDRERALSDEARAEESLSNSRRALDISESASRRALIAIALSTTMAIYEIIKWASSKQ